jgi:hypothetical protein
VAGSETGSAVGAKTFLKVGSGVGSEINHYGSTTLLFYPILMTEKIDRKFQSKDKEKKRTRTDLDEKVCDLEEAAAAGEGERCLLCLLGLGVDVRALTEEQGHHLLVTLAARLHQRRVPLVVHLKPQGFFQFSSLARVAS